MSDGNVSLKEWAGRTIVSLALFIGSAIPSSAYAANRYWVGGTDGANTNDTANWASANPASCTGGGASVPGTGDVAIFDPDCDNGAAIDAPFTVQKIELQSGYDGVVTQNAGIGMTLDPGSSGDAFVVAGGAFVGGDTVITINDGNFNQTGGAFTNSSGGMTVEQSFTVSSGTFTNTSKTVTFTDSSTADDTTVTCSGTLGGSFVITKDSDADFINGSGCTISLGASPTTTIDNGATNDFTNNGTIIIPSGTWTVNGQVTSTEAVMTNAGTITHSGDGWDFNDIALINTSGATITYAGTAIAIERSFTQSGMFDLTGKTITFDDTSAADDTTVACTGTLGGTVVITKDTSGDFIVASGCSISLGSSPLSAIGVSSSATYTNNGTITIPSGTWQIDGISTSVGSMFTNAGTITHSGDGWDINDTHFVNSSGATITYTGTSITIERSFTQSGTFDLTGITITFYDTGSIDDTTITCSETLGGTVVITKDTNGDFIVASGCSIDLGANPTTSISASAANDFVNNGTVVIPSGTWTVNGVPGNDATLTNSGTITHSGDGWDMNDTNLLNNSGATIAYSGTSITIENIFRQHGTFDLTGKIVTLDDTDSNDIGGITCTGELGGTVVITKDSDGAVGIGSGCSVSLGASPTTTIDADAIIASLSFGLAVSAFTNNGTIIIPSGTWTVNGQVTSTGAVMTNAGTITHNGDGWDFNDVSFTNGTGATTTYAGSGIAMERNFTQYGTFDMTGITATFDDTDSDDDTVLTCSGILSGTMVNAKNSGGDFSVSSGCSVTLVVATSSTVSVSSSVSTQSRGGHSGSPEQMQRKIQQAQTFLFGTDRPTDSSAGHTETDLQEPLTRVADRDGRLVMRRGTQEVVYSDVVAASWYAQYVSILMTEGIAEGYKDADGNLTGEYGVANPVTKAEVLKMALEVTNTRLVRSNPRNASAGNTWASAYVATAESLLLSVFHPSTDVHQHATRGEVLQIIVEIVKAPRSTTPPPFTDVPADHPYAPAIAAAFGLGLIEGDKGGDGTLLHRFRPDAFINRAEVSKIIAMMLNGGKN